MTRPSSTVGICPAISRSIAAGPYADNLILEVLVVGAGFGGTSLLCEVRKQGQGHRTVPYDTGSGYVAL